MASMGMYRYRACMLQWVLPHMLQTRLMCGCLTCCLKLVWRSVCGELGVETADFSGKWRRCSWAAALHNCGGNMAAAGGMGLLIAPRKDFIEFCVCNMRLT